MLLDFNKLSGTLPMSYQTYGKFKIFSIENNRINGTLSSFDINNSAIPSVYINMAINRLSGKVPDSFRSSNPNINLSIARGNLFECPNIKLDSNYSTESCGSWQIFFPTICWFISIIISSAMILVLLYRKSSSMSRLCKEQVLSWWSEGKLRLNPILHYKEQVLKIAINKLPDDHLFHTKLILDLMERASSTAFCLSCIYIVAMITYIIMKTKYQAEYSLFVYQYLYTTTNIYTHGTTGAVLTVVYLFISTFVAFSLLLVIKPSASNRNQTKMPQSSQELEKAMPATNKPYLILISIHFINLLMAAGFNIIYLYLYIAASSDVLTSTPMSKFEFTILKMILEAFISIYRMGNMSLFIPWLISKLSYVSISVRQINQTWLNLLDAVIIPLLLIVFISPSCFNFMLQKNAKLQIQEQFTVPIELSDCQPRRILDDNQNFFKYMSSIVESPMIGNLVLSTANNIQVCQKTTRMEQIVVQNEPPFIYSFQCSSSLISYYITVFIYIYTLLGTLLPVLKLKLMLLSTNGYLCYIQKKIPVKKISEFLNHYLFSLNENTILESFRNTPVTRISNPIASDDIWCNRSIRYMGSSVISQLTVHIVIMLTFALSSPILALMISVYITVNTCMWRLAIGRYIKILVDNPELDYSMNIQILENSSKDEWTSISNCWWITQIVVGLFWSFMLFDMIGGSEVNTGIAGSIVLLILYSTITIFSKNWVERNSSHSFVQKYQKFAFSIHSYIWINIYKIGCMRQEQELAINSSNVISKSTLVESYSPFAHSSLHDNNNL